MIYRLLFRRHGTILPGDIKYYKFPNATSTIGDWHKRYKYQWNELHQDYAPCEEFIWESIQPEYPQGYYGSPQNVEVSVFTEPTFAQAQLIEENERTTLPFTFKNDYGVQIGCNFLRRGHNGEAGLQIINRIKVELPGFQGIALFRVCKQLQAECSEILYGENTFAFTTGSGGSGTREHAHQHGELSYFLPFTPGRPQSQRQILQTIDRIFDNTAHRPSFIRRDPMLDFFHRIGRFNASFLSKIELEGDMKTVLNTLPDHQLDAKPPIGFAIILPLLTSVLKNTCPRLRVLTLHIEETKQYMQLFRWDHDPYNEEEKTDEERFDEVVEHVVSELDSLEVLQLGGHKNYTVLRYWPIRRVEDEWGKAARWMEIVRKRTEERVTQCAMEQAMEQASQKLE